MTTNLINPKINLNKIFWGPHDEEDKNFEGIKNIREYEDDLKKLSLDIKKELQKHIGTKKIDPDIEKENEKTYEKMYVKCFLESIGEKETSITINKEECCIETSRCIYLQDNHRRQYKNCSASFNCHFNFDYVLKLPYHKDLDIHNDIIESIMWEVGYKKFVSSNMYDLEIYNWLFGKEIEIKDGYLYLPLSNNINIFYAYIDIFLMNCSISLNIKFKEKYIDFLNKLNEKKDIEKNDVEEKPLGWYSWFLELYSWIFGFKNINKKNIEEEKNINSKFKIRLLHKMYDIRSKELFEKLNFNTWDNTQKIIQNQNFTQNIKGEINEIINIKFTFNNPIFSLFVYGFDIDDISDVHDFPGKSSNLFDLSEAIKDVQLIINDQYIYDVVLKEIIPKIYVLEFADPLLFDTIFSEPISNTDIFNKKTINFSRIDDCKIRFKKTNNKSFQFNIVGLNYNFIRFVSNMVGIRYVF